MTSTPVNYKRVLIKLSGEALMADLDYGIDAKMLARVASEITEVVNMGVEVALVIGGGNIYRGLNAEDQGIDRVAGDQMGMLATIINAIALQNAFENAGIYTRLMSAISMQAIAEPYIRRKAIRHLEKGRVVIFGAGTGHPYFSTDTAAALRAIEIEADTIIKGTRVDGIYNSDPEKNTDAVKYDEITYQAVMDQNLKVMDLTAITLCRENSLPLIVFNMNKENNLFNLINGKNVGTIVDHKF